MSNLFSPDDTPQAEQDLARIRAAGFHPYSGTGQENGYWSRKGDPRVYTTAQALAELEQEGGR